MLDWAYTNLELPVEDLFTMWASPGIIPINISFIYWGSVIKALSAEDKRVIPFVDRAAYNAPLEHKRILNESC